MSLKTYRDYVKQALNHASYLDAHEREAMSWWILEHITGLNKSRLILTNNLVLSDSQKEQLEQILHKITQEDMPLTYIIGSIAFLDLNLQIKPPTLIPRPETEQWCADLIAQLSKLTNKNITIIDVCTGSGCIALSLAKALPQAHVYALDISKSACQLAQENAQLNAITNIEIIGSDLFAQLNTTIKADIIVSNPPYINEKNWQTLDPHIKKWEDFHALVAPENGLALIRAIAQKAKNRLKYNQELTEKAIPQVLMEIGYDQGQQAQEIFAQANFDKITIIKDLSGNNRVITAGLPTCDY